MSPNSATKQNTQTRVSLPLSQGDSGDCLWTNKAEEHIQQKVQKSSFNSKNLRIFIFSCKYGSHLYKYSKYSEEFCECIVEVTQFLLTPNYFSLDKKYFL